MAYTYNDFVTAANSAGLLDQFTDDDLRITQSNPEYGLSLLSLKQNYANAQTDEQRLLATEAANQLRKNYAAVQNSGGTLNYTSPYNQQISDTVDKISSYGDFEYTGNDSYQKLLQSVTGQNGMDYDYTQDPQWSAAKKMYLREGDRAIQDTLAKASVTTGGRPSSYAVTAAALAGNNYAAQLTDMIPTLYQQELQRRMNAIGALEGDRNFQYQNWQNGYNLLQNDLNNYLQREQTDYARFLQRYNDALTTYQTLGYATPEIAEILGLDATSAQTGSGSSYVGSNVGGVNNGTLTESEIAQLQMALNEQLGAGLMVDGAYGDMSRTAAGGLSAEEAYAKYVAGVPVGTGNLTSDKIVQIQWALGVPRTGVWDNATMSASGYTDSNAAYDALVKGKIGEPQKGVMNNYYLGNGYKLQAELNRVADDNQKASMIYAAYQNGEIDEAIAEELFVRLSLV